MEVTLENLRRLADAQSLAALLGLILVVIAVFFREPSPILVVLGLYFLVSWLSHFVAMEFISRNLPQNYVYSGYSTIIVPVNLVLYYFGYARKHGWLLGATASFHFAFGVLNALYIQEENLNSYTAISECIIMISAGVFYFYYLVKHLPTSKIQDLPLFWVSSAFIIYYSGSLLLFTFAHYLIQVLNNNLLAYWLFHHLLSILELIILNFAVLVFIKKGVQMHSMN